ncbi:MAG: ABC transporter permease [Dehalococcoidia bacterium]|nr:ABC transporter permease [Dehalococcoidia bacterium]
MSRRAVAVTVAGLLLVWGLVALAVRSSLLPPPWAVAVTFAQDLPAGLGWHTLVSLWRIGASMALAAVVGVPLGLALGQSRRWDRLAAPLVYITYPVPKIVFLPVILLFLGIGDLSKIFLITLILVFQVLVVVRDASRNVRPELVSSVRSLGADGRQLFRHVYFPACLPATLTALRLSIGTAIAVLFFAESFATRSGLGFLVMDSWQALNYRQMYAAVVAMALTGLGIYILLDQLESRFCRWAKASDAS